MAETYGLIFFGEIVTILLDKNNATGAGDAFWGGFLYQFCRCGKLPEEVSVSETASFADFGNAVASVCVESYGAIPAMPTMEQVIEKMQEERQE